MPDVWQLGAVETATLVRARELSAIDVLDAHLARLAQVNPGLNAVTVVLEDEARAAARAVDAALARREDPGPLAGVPVTVKENIDQRGQATPNGVPALADALAPDDAPAVERLRRAGAIVIGRTNTPEFSLRWFTENPLRGRTLNPRDATRTCGGSSGGAAAAVAAGIGALALGTDLGGSLRYPAYCCGVATLKPSLGRVAAWNPGAAEERGAATTMMSATGPIARDVEDLRLALAVLAGADARDPLAAPVPTGLPAPQSRRVAMCIDPAGTGVHADVAAAVTGAARRLVDAGYVVEAVAPPDFDAVATGWGRLIATEIRVLLDAAIRRHGSADAQRAVAGLVEHFGVLDLDGYVRALAQRQRHRRAWAQFMERWPLVLLPVSAEPPFATGEDLAGADRLQAIVAAQAPLYAINYLGLPAAAVPTGEGGGAPIGVQIVGRRWGEEECLVAAEAVASRG